MKCGLDERLALLVFGLCKLDDQDSILGGKPNEHHQADLGVDIALDLNHIRGLEKGEHKAA